MTQQAEKSNLVHEVRVSIEARIAKYNDPRNLEWEWDSAPKWEKHALNAVLDLLKAEARLGELERERDEARLEADDKIRLARIQTANFEAAEARAEKAEAERDEANHEADEQCRANAKIISEYQASLSTFMEALGCVREHTGPSEWTWRNAKADTLAASLRDVGEIVKTEFGAFEKSIEGDRMLSSRTTLTRSAAADRIRRFGVELLTHLSTDTKEEKNAL